MNIVSLIARIVMGLIFVVFGLNGFLGFMETPPLPEQAGQFMGILFTSGWLPFVKILEIVGGALLLASIPAKRFAPLALVILGPVVVNIFLFHLFLAPAGLVLPIVLVVLQSFLVFYYWSSFAPIFRDHS